MRRQTASRLLAATCLATALAAPALVAAQELSVSAGATVTTRYMASGLEQSDGPAFQPWIEAEINGFYAGLWASNVSRAITGSSTEIDVYFGYRNEVGRFNYDIGYARYLYRGPSVNCCGELYLSMGVSVTDQLDLGARIAYDPKAKVANTSLNAAWAFNDSFSMDATLGRVSKGGQRYWSVGASHALNDNVSLGLAWHDTSITKGRVVASVDFSFSVR